MVFPCCCFFSSPELSPRYCKKKGKRRNVGHFLLPEFKRCGSGDRLGQLSNESIDEEGGALFFQNHWTYRTKLFSDCRVARVGYLSIRRFGSRITDLSQRYCLFSFHFLWCRLCKRNRQGK